MRPDSGGLERTLEMTVENTGFLVDRLGEDCAPLQYLRELTENSIRAIEETSAGTGRITWDLDWVEFDLTGMKKLCIIDTGVGMSGEEMRNYINKLSSSSHLQGLDGHFGIGAKIAGATRNHAGMLYLSWQDGTGVMSHLWRDPDQNTYGLREVGGGEELVHWGLLESAVKPEEIDRHGTKVVLYGMQEDDDTMTAPAGVASPSRWIAKYLNTRYFRFPDGIEVRAREGWEHPLSDKDRNLLRRIIGQEEYLAKHCEASGVLNLDEAKAHWWILKSEKALSQESGSFNSVGHMAALHDDELYEIATAKSGVALLQQFGVVFGHNRICIYVEPLSEVRTNTARTSLLIENRPLPWSEWAAEFRASMPPEIQNHMDSVVVPASDEDRRNAIRERLRRIEHLLKLTRYRRTPQGSVGISDHGPHAGDLPQNPAGVRVGSSSRGGKSSRAGSVYALFVDEDGGNANPTRGLPEWPEVDWISIDNGKREPGDLEDRAARYLLEQHHLLINEDFRVFNQMIDQYATDYGDSSSNRRVIREEIRQWFEQALIEAVVCAHSIKGRHWSYDELQRLLSEESLTAVVLPRYHVDVSVRRGLGVKLGSLKAKQAS